jgi:membrane protease YdiL (CAAX protease family)
MRLEDARRTRFARETFFMTTSSSSAPAGQPRPANLRDRISHWALLRILVFAAALVVTMIVASRGLSLLIPPAPSPLHADLAMLRNLVLAALLLGLYALLVRWIERRGASEIDLRAGGAQLPIGAALGMALMAGVYLILWGMGRASFAPGTGMDGLAVGLVAAFLAAVFEELLLRAVLFRIVEQACGTMIALVVSAAIFGLLHSFNPGATAFSDAAIAIEAGLMLAMAYALTRNLWLAIGIHMGWNFTEGSLFGAQVSGGATSHSLIHATLSGPQLLTGGVFGPEASIVTVVVCGLTAGVIAVVVVRRGGWRPRRFSMSLA